MGFIALDVWDKLLRLNKDGRIIFREGQGQRPTSTRKEEAHTGEAQGKEEEQEAREVQATEA